MAGTSSRRTGMIVVSTIMLILALPGAWFALQFINSFNTSYTEGLAAYTGLGLMIGSFAYLASPILSVLGYLSTREKVRPVARVLGVIMLIVLIVAGIMQMAMFLFTSLPLFILTILYLVFLRPGKQQTEPENGDGNVRPYGPR